MPRLLCALAVAAVASPAIAQPAPAVKVLAVTPAAEPVPALTYTFLPTLRDRTTGNAALEYYRAFAALPSGRTAAERAKAEEVADAWRVGPANVPPPPEVRGLLLDYTPALRQADRAARCDHCDWAVEDRVRTDIMNAAGQETGPLRELGRALAWRTRVELADRKYEAAARSLQTGFQLARHTAEFPLLIHLLVAVTIAQAQLEQVEAWAATPGAPNLYWALAGLPRPLADLRRGLEAEAGFPDTIPWLGWKPLEQGPVTREVADRVVGRWVANVVKSGTPEELTRIGLDGPVGDVGLAAVLTLRYPAAKRWLLAHGHAAAEVDAMPAAQAVFLYDLALFRELRDDAMKWHALPFPEAHAGLQKALAHRRKVLDENWNAPILKTLVHALPALDKLHYAGVRADRTVAALRAIEAVRLHAALNNGAIPARLADVTAVPVPNDPVTGTPFRYELRGRTFTLTGPPPAGDTPNPGNALAYEVTVSPK